MPSSRFRSAVRTRFLGAVQPANDAEEIPIASRGVQTKINPLPARHVGASIRTTNRHCGPAA